MRKMVIMLCVVLILGVAGLQADEQSFVSSTKQVVKEYGPAVVWLGATAKIDIGSGQVQEQTLRCPGMVIDTNGLTITALNQIDPTPLITASIKRHRKNLNPSVTITDVKVIWADGDETSAEISFKDPDLDLAFIKPSFAEGKTSPVTKPISLVTDSKAEIFDRVLSLGRLEDRYQREIVALERRIAAIVKRPRRLYYIQELVPGSPIFTEDGRFLGLSVTRFFQQDGPNGARVFVLPVEDIRDVAEQVE